MIKRWLGRWLKPWLASVPPYELSAVNAAFAKEVDGVILTYVEEQHIPIRRDVGRALSIMRRVGRLEACQLLQDRTKLLIDSIYDKPDFVVRQNAAELSAACLIAACNWGELIPSREERPDID